MFVAPGTTTRLVFDQMFAIGSLGLVDGSEVKIIAHRVKPSSEEAGRLAIAREQALHGMVRSLGPGAATLDGIANARMAVHGDQSDGTRFSVDLAAYPPPPGHAVICTGKPILVPVLAVNG